MTTRPFLYVRLNDKTWRVRPLQLGLESDLCSIGARDGAKCPDLSHVKCFRVGIVARPNSDKLNDQAGRSHPSHMGLALKYRHSSRNTVNYWLIHHYKPNANSISDQRHWANPFCAFELDMC